VRVVDVLPRLQTSRFDRPLTYLVPAEFTLAVGDIVRVPLGARDVWSYVIAGPYESDALPGVTFRPVRARPDSPRAFTSATLDLARWIAEYYVCTLGEALGAVVLASAIPRAEERYTIARERSGHHAAVPERLAHLIWGDLREGFTREALLRHPEARRSGDRATLLDALRTLVARGDLVRTRRLSRPRLAARTERLLIAAEGAPPSGKRAQALVAAVAATGVLRRADALLAGFSSTVIARAVGSGALRENVRTIESEGARPSIALPELVPTDEQRTAITAMTQAIDGGAFAELLVHGITGSGKTLAYIHAVAHVVRNGGRAIVLVPEISLTPQTARRFEAVFGARVAVLHSALSERERYDAWQRAARGDVDVVVGARSAVFAPLDDVRFIVIDEAHETTYKQDSVPRYSALTVARERMRRAAGTLVLASATPPIDEYARARAGRSTLIRLTQRATDAPLPATGIIDMRAELQAGNRRVFSAALVEGIERRLERREKTVLFVNRRGSAAFLLCRTCGYVAECTRCTTSLVVHRAEHRLRCHHCDLQRPLPERCPACHSDAIREFGIGTQRVVAEVERLFPAARIVRMDSDTTTRIGDHARLLDAFAREGDVLVGTQMVAKGLDFPDVTLVGIVAADIGLHVADYRAAERTFSLIVQAGGRSGRTGHGESIVQTYSPEHPAVALAVHADYENFARLELAERRPLRYPPFGALVYLGAISRDEQAARSAIDAYATILRASDVGETLGPAPYPIARLAGEWRFRLAVKSRVRDDIRRTIREQIVPLARADRHTRLVINIDP